jgi:hypothetical protein
VPENSVGAIRNLRLTMYIGDIPAITDISSNNSILNRKILKNVKTLYVFFFQALTCPFIVKSILNIP